MSLKKKLEVAEPCDKIPWEPGAKSQYCDHCQHDVVNLSRLTKREVDAGLKQGLFTCVAYEVKPDGHPRLLERAKTSSALSLAGAMLVSACHTPAQADGVEGEVVAAQQPIESPSIAGEPEQHTTDGVGELPTELAKKGDPETDDAGDDDAPCEDEPPRKDRARPVIRGRIPRLHPPAGDVPKRRPKKKARS